MWRRRPSPSRQGLPTRSSSAAWPSPRERRSSSTGRPEEFGTFAVQIATARGARVIASASAPRHEALRELGAAWCVDYRTEDVPSAARELAGAELDAVADFVGGDLISRSLEVIRPFGSAASIASVEGDLE